MKKLIVILISFILLSLSTSAFAINPSHEKLLESSTKDKQFVLGFIILESGYDCVYPRTIYFQGFDKSETAYWNIDCENCTFRIEIKNDANGSLQVVPCDELYPDEVPCFKPFKE